MTKIGFHFSHEQFSPSQLLKEAQRVGDAGFTHGMCSDHFAPWTPEQGHSGYTWSWLGAALQATQMEFGTVTAPGQRYHPAVLAQKIATLSEMFEGRVWVAFGSGEFLNEHITGERWPEKAKRNERLQDSLDVIRKLLRGEEVSHEGSIHVHEAKLYSRPTKQPLLVGAALSEETAEWMGAHFDALVTVGDTPEKLEKRIAAFRRGGGQGKPIFLQEQISYAPTFDEALKAASDQWMFSTLDRSQLSDLTKPEQFKKAIGVRAPEEVTKSVRVSASFEDHAKWLQQNIDLGFDRIYLHNVCREHQNYVSLFKDHVFPKVRGLDLKD